MMHEETEAQEKKEPALSSLNSNLNRLFMDMDGIETRLSKAVNRLGCEQLPEKGNGADNVKTPTPQPASLISRFEVSVAELEQRVGRLRALLTRLETAV